jgi:hypothetical protein
MQQAYVGTDNLGRGEFESACRNFWLAYVMMEAGARLGDKSPRVGPASGQALNILFAS